MRVVSFFHVGEVPFYLPMMVESVKAVLGWPLIQMTDDDTPELEGVDERGGGEHR